MQTRTQVTNEAAVVVQDDPAYQEYLNEPLPQDLSSAAMAEGERTEIIVKADEDKLSSSLDSFASPADLDKFKAMPADELHKEIIGTYIALGENAIAYQGMVLVARQRMHDGEKVGGCNTWNGEEGYANKYFRRPDEKLPTCLRRLRRALEGNNPDTKHRNKRKKSNKQIAEEGTERQHVIEVKQARELGFKEGEASGIKKAELLAVAKQKTAGTSHDEKGEIEKVIELADQLARKAVLLTTIKGAILTKKNGKELLSLAKCYIKLRGIGLFADLENGADGCQAVRA